VAAPSDDRKLQSARARRHARAVMLRWRSISNPDRAGLPASLLLLAVLAGLDAWLGSKAVFTGSYLLAPFLAAFLGGRRATLVVGGAAISLAALSGAWNGNFDEADYYLGLAVLVLGCGFAYLAAAARSDSQDAMRRLHILNDVAEVADGTHSLSETMQRVTDVIVPELADFCMIDVIAEGRATRVAVRGDGPRRAEVESRLSDREPSLPEYMLRNSDAPLLEPRFVSRHTDDFLRGMAHDSDDLEFLRSLGTRSSISVGLSARGQQLGALTLVTAWSGRSFSADDVRFSRVLAGRVGLALDNAGLFSDLQSVERRMDIAMSILGEAVVIQDRHGELIYANDAAAKALGSANAQPIASSLEELRGRYDLYDEEGNPLDLNDFISLRILRGEQMDAQTVRAIERTSGREVWLLARSRPIEGPDNGPLYAVTTFENVTDFKQREFAQAMLARTGELLDSSIDHRETLRSVAKIAIPHLADWCAVYAAGEEGSLDLLAIAHSDAAKTQLAREIVEEFPLGPGSESFGSELLAAGEPIVIEDLVPSLQAFVKEPRQLELLEELGIGTVMLVPMLAPNQVIGALVLANDKDRRAFDSFDRSLAGRIAERAAIAIENARLATERTQIAVTLQKGLAPPQIPEIPGWTAAAVYRPAGSENRVGGDFYDAFPYERDWMIVVGDVTGRGARAAAITALARHTIRTAGSLTGDPLTALQMLNTSLRAHEGNALCSAAIVVLPGDDSDRELQMVVAGHPPPLILREGKVEEVGTRGPVLGAFDDPDWQVDTTALQPGEQLILYTDGVTEANGEDGRFGEERLREQVKGATTPAAAIRRVETALERFTLGHLGDDAALLAVMREHVREPLAKRDAADGTDGERGITVA
jgi:PAS domain S-box-containing protein